MSRTDNSRLRIADLQETIAARPDAVIADLVVLRELTVELDPLIPGHGSNAHGHAVAAPCQHQFCGNVALGS